MMFYPHTWEKSLIKNMRGINGGAVTTLASGLNHPNAIALDSTSVYWVDLG